MENTDTGGRVWNILSSGTANSGGAGNLHIYDELAPSTRLFIQGGTGNVGIGTTSPSGMLDISLGTGVGTKGLRVVRPAGSDNNRFIELQSSAIDDNSYWIYTNGNDPGDTFVVRGDGNVGIGDVSPTDKLTVDGDISIPVNRQIMIGGESDSNWGIKYTPSCGTYGPNGVCFDIKAGANNGNVRFVDNDTNDVMVVDLYLNRVGIGTTYPGSRLDVQGGCITGSICSDKNMKKNIQSLSQEISYLDKVLQLNGVSFEWKNKKDKKRYYGLIAQDVKKVIPEVVSDSVKGQIGLSCTGIDAVLVEAIKELKAKNENKIEALSQENTALKEELSSIKKEMNTLQQAVAKLQGVAGDLNQ